MVYFCLTNFLQYSLQRGEIPVNIIDCSDSQTSPLNAQVFLRGLLIRYRTLRQGGRFP